MCQRLTNKKPDTIYQFQFQETLPRHRENFRLNPMGSDFHETNRMPLHFTAFQWEYGPTMASTSTSSTTSPYLTKSPAENIYYRFGWRFNVDSIAIIALCFRHIYVSHGTLRMTQHSAVNYVLMLCMYLSCSVFVTLAWDLEVSRRYRLSNVYSRKMNTLRVDYN